MTTLPLEDKLDSLVKNHHFDRLKGYLRFLQVHLGTSDANLICVTTWTCLQRPYYNAPTMHAPQCWTKKFSLLGCGASSCPSPR